VRPQNFWLFDGPLLKKREKWRTPSRYCVSPEMWRTRPNPRPSHIKAKLLITNCFSALDGGIKLPQLGLANARHAPDSPKNQ